MSAAAQRNIRSDVLSKREEEIRMKQSVCVGLLAIMAAVTTLHATPTLAGVSGRWGATLTSRVLNGDATVADLVRRTAARCQCAPAPQAGSAAGVALPSVNVGSASGAAGQQVTFSVSLSTAGEMVAGVQNDLAFDSI